MIYLPGGKFLLNGSSPVIGAEACCCHPNCSDCPGVACSNCPDSIAPSSFNVLFGSTGPTPRCVFESSGAKRVWHLYANLSGLSFNVPQSASPCIYDLILAAGIIGLTECVGDGSGCAGCTGGSDITTSAILRVKLNPGASAPDVSFIITAPPSFPTLTIAPRILSSVDAANPCCGTSTALYQASDGTEDRNQTLVDGGHTVTPCDA